LTENLSLLHFWRHRVVQTGFIKYYIREVELFYSVTLSVTAIGASTYTNRRQS